MKKKRLNVTVVFTIEVDDDVDPGTVITNVDHIEFEDMNRRVVATEPITYCTVSVQPAEEGDNGE